MSACIPSAPIELTARVEGMMRRNRSDAGSADVIQHGDLRLHRFSRQVTLGDEEIKLTKLEFTLLDHLLSKGGAVATRKELAEVCWGPDSEDDGHLMSVHIANLRKKIGCDGSQVTTVRGIGYRLGMDISMMTDG